MIKNIKLGVKMFRYAYGLKMNVIMGAGFLLFGIAMCTLGPDTNMGFLGEYLLVCIGIIPAQLLYSLSASNMVQASPGKKKMQTTIPALVTWAGMTVLYLAIAAVWTAGVLNRPETAGAAGGKLMMTAIIMMILMAYTGLAYKYFAVSIVIVVLMAFGMNSTMGIGLEISLFGGLGFGLSAGLGLMCVAAGGILQYLISLLFYKVPMSKMAQLAPLRREL